MADQGDNRGVPLKPAQPVTKPADWWRPGNLRGSAEPSPPPPQKAEPQSEPSSKQVDVRTMIVGSGTSFSGEITACNRLIVEGSVKAKLGTCQELIVNESGSFTGECSTENAEIHGSLEGDLVIGKRLLVRATGRVSGTIAYGEIEIERGGKISGVIQASGERAIPNAVRAAAAKALAMGGRGRKSARPRDYGEPARTEEDPAGPGDRGIPGI
jgi:cytoskeletal protein CcmA (bactofilin family)